MRYLILFFRVRRSNDFLSQMGMKKYCTIWGGRDSTWQIQPSVFQDHLCGVPALHFAETSCQSKFMSLLGFSAGLVHCFGLFSLGGFHCSCLSPKNWTSCAAEDIFHKKRATGLQVSTKAETLHGLVGSHFKWKQQNVGNIFSSSMRSDCALYRHELFLERRSCMWIKVSSVWVRAS